MAQEPSSKELLDAVKQQESGGRRYDKSGNLLEGPQTKYGTAKGEMQVLDMTNKDPGFGVRPARDNSADERARVGRDYLAAMVNRYGDKKTALIAYNWGPGNTDTWLKEGADPAKLPAETQNYVAKITGSFGTTKVAQATTKPNSGIQRAVYKAAPLTHPMLAMLGPNYQAAMAVSMLADEGEKEGKSESDDSESAKMLAAAPSRPVALAQADLSFQSPFPEIQKPQQQPMGMAAGGVPYVPTPTVRGSSKQELDKVKSQWDAYNTRAGSYNTELEKYTALVDAYNKGPRTDPFTGVEPVAPVQPTVSAAQYQAMADAARKDVARRGMAIAVAANPEQFGISLNKFFAEGGEVSGPDIGDAPARETLARMFANQETVAGMGDMTTAGVGRNFDVGGGNLNIGAALTSMTKDEKQELAKNLMASYTRNIGDATVGMSINKPLDIPADVYQAALMGSMPIGQGRAMISAQGTRVNGQDYPVNQMIGYEHPVGSGQLSFNASQMKDFPESRQYQLQYRMPLGRADGGEVDYFQDPMGVADSGPVTADTFAKGKDFKAADALQAAKEVGKGMVRSGRAIAQGVSETPYNVVGAPVDIATMAMRPFGYNVQEPTGGSEHLKRLALEAGIRQAPPIDPRDLGYYTMGELGSSIVNPGPIAAKVGQTAEKLATTGGRTVAKEMLRGMEGKGVLAPISPQDSIMYAVKPKGGAFTGTREYEYPRPGTEGRVAFEDSVTSLIKSGELLPDLRTDLPMPMQSRKALDGWVGDKIGSYIRKDMATKNDPFVKAVDEGKKLHLLEDLGDIKPMSGLARRRDREGFPAWGSAKTPLGRKLEKQIDSSMWSEDIGDVNAYNMHPLMEGFRDTSPNMPIYTPGAQIANRMQFPKMIEGMEDMLSTDKNYKAYGEFSTPIPEEYHLTPEKLQGMSAVQASEKVGLFNQWRDGERQIQAAQYLNKHGNIYKKYDNGRKWIAMDDLAEEPQQAELAQQAGCLGGWCTKDESFAMQDGSGDNRLNILFDEKAVPRVQLTVTKTTPTVSDFYASEFNSSEDVTRFENKYGNLKYLPDEQIQATPEYQAWVKLQGNPERITEIKGQFNRAELAKDPNSGKYLKEVQDFVKSKDWGTVANLDGINMIDLDDHLPTLSRGLNPEQTNQLSDFMKSLNGGSRYADKQEGANILKEASLRVFQPFTPPGRATGGMVERQASTARYI